jgi:putative MATE family efflux protein
MSTATNDLLQGPVDRVIRRMSTPIGVGLVSTVLTFVVDLYFVGKLGAAPLAAMSLTVPLVALICNVLMGLGTGVTAVVAHLVGARDKAGASRVSTHALVLSVGFSLGLGLLAWAVARPLLRWMGGTAEAVGLATAYLDVWYLCLPGAALIYTGTAALRAVGDAKSSAVAMFIAALLNIGLDPLLIFGVGPFPRLGIVGAAVATVVGYSAAAGYTLLRANACGLVAWPQALRGTRRSAAAILPISIPGIVTQAMMPVGVAFLMALVAGYGSAMLAAVGVGMRVEGFVRLGPLALGGAVRAVVAQCWGARAIGRAQESVSVSRRYAFVWGALAWALLALGSRSIAGQFSDDVAIRDALTTFLRLSPLGYAAMGTVTVAAAALGSVGHATRGAYLAILRAAAVMVPMAYVGGVIAGYPGMLLGSALANVVTEAISAFWLRKAGLIRSACVPDAKVMTEVPR